MMWTLGGSANSNGGFGNNVPISDAIDAPQWISSGAVIAGGLDLLGLRLPVQTIGGTLLDGITTVTPQVRYVAFRAWLIHRYGQTGLPDSWRSFTEFALRIESALVLGNLANDRRIGGLIGADEAVRRLDGDTPLVSISALVKSPAATIYAGPSDQLGVTRTRDDAVPALVIERGQPLAQLTERRLATVPLIRRLLEDPSITQASLDELREIGAVARIDQIPDDERDALLASIVPPNPRPNDRPRIATYTALLSLASVLKTCPSEQDLFEAACSKQRFGDPVLDRAADGWTTYCVRDAIAVTQESVLSAVMTEVTTHPDEGLTGVNGSTVIASLMERVDEHASGLQDLGLLALSESISDLSFRELQRRIDQSVGSSIEHRNGLSRWGSALSETMVYQLSWRVGAGALTLAVVAWILAALRVGRGVREGGQDFGNLSHQGWRRMGLREVILPELERFHRENLPLREVAAELAYRTVNQHLQIAWSRLQADPRRDVALLTTEGNTWYARGKGFGGGRTASRLAQAVGWLQQLRLIDAGGITPDGEVVRQDGLRILSTGGV